MNISKRQRESERSIEIIRKMGGKYGLQLNEQKIQYILINIRRKKRKNIIEVVEEMKYLGVIVQVKRSVFEGQQNEMMEKV